MLFCYEGIQGRVVPHALLYWWQKDWVCPLPRACTHHRCRLPRSFLAIDRLKKSKRTKSTYKYQYRARVHLLEHECLYRRAPYELYEQHKHKLQCRYLWLTGCVLQYDMDRLCYNIYKRCTHTALQTGKRSHVTLIIFWGNIKRVITVSYQEEKSLHVLYFSWNQHLHTPFLAWYDML